MLEASLETLNDVWFGWHVSPRDFSPPGPMRTSMNPMNLFTASRGRYSRPPSASGASAAQGTQGWLPGASGDLSLELAHGGRGFARIVGDDAVLLTFLPAFDRWRELVSERLTARDQPRASSEGSKEGGGKDCDPGRRQSSPAHSRASQQAERRARYSGGVVADGAAGVTGAGAVSSAGVPLGEGVTGPESFSTPTRRESRAGRPSSASRGGGRCASLPPRETQERIDDEHSLGLYLFLVRAGDFGLPIDLQHWKLRDVRQILLAHAPERPGVALAPRPHER